LKVAIIHYWFITRRGGEKVVESILKLYPNADIYTLFYDENKYGDSLKNHNIYTSILNIPFLRKYYQKIFPLYPIGIRSLKLKENYDLLVVDFHGEITSEKNAIGHFFDGKATLVVGTHTHIPTNDARILKSGTGYQTDAGMCGDYDSVIGMNTENSLNRFLKKNSTKHFPALGEATLCGVIVDCNIETGLANNIESYISGGQLSKT
jgi:calcineurin-like phosphoesterase